jgi:3-phosphoglycerate kinase
MNALNKKSVEDLDVKGKRVLVRCDFNVPLKDGEITNDKRIVAALPTIKYLMEQGAKVILCSHLGRPKGEYKPEFSLAPVAKRLSEYLGVDVPLAEDENVVGDNAKKMAADLQDGQVMLLENVRYRAEETKNEENFSKELASLADLFVNDNILVLSQRHIHAQVLAQALGHGSQAELRLILALRSAQVGAQNHLGALLHQVLNGGQCSHNTLVIGDLAVFQRNIKVAAYQYALAFNIQIFNGFFVQCVHKITTPSS